MHSMLPLTLAAALLFGSGMTASASDAHGHGAAAKQISNKTAETRAAMRDLWLHHVFWIRTVVVATLAKNDAAMRAAEQETVANAKAIAGAIEPFYGSAAKDALFKLLAGHYGAVKAYLVADDAASQGTATEALTKNAEEVAVFLSKANPNLPKEAVSGLLLAHGGHHIQQIQDLRAAKYDAEARTWGEMKAHIYAIADALTQALAKQFATRF
jgi:hypothetical protein